jgi:hypothetical protein
MVDNEVIIETINNGTDEEVLALPNISNQTPG